MSIAKYGRVFQTDRPLDVEYWCFRNGLTVEQGGLGRHKHFENIVRETWPDFVWFDEAYEQADALCNYPVSGFMAGASYAKSDLLAKFGLVSWWSHPVETLVILCSTTAIDAKQRVWGHVVRDFRKARAAGKAVGRLVESQSIIKLNESDDGVAASDNSSVCLVAAGNEYKDDALKRLEGRKNKRVVLLIDEGQDVNPDIINTAIWNLSANENFEVHMAGNGTSRVDTLGEFMKPIEGWNAVNRTTHKWPIKVGGMDGIALHFDATAEHSTNMKRFAQGMPQLPFLRKAEEIISARTHLGENNVTYMRQFVGFPPDGEGESNFLVTEQSLTSHEAFDRPEWRSAPMELAGIDPSYSNEGDEFIFHHVRWGMATNGIWQLTSHEEISVRAIPAPGQTKDHANIAACKRIAEERNISPRNIGMDNTGGNPLLSIAHMHWSSDIMGVPFGGSPTDLPISQFDKRIGGDVYSNAVSELWGVFVEFLNSGQIRGIKPQMAKELTARKYEYVAGMKLKVEKKTDMKKRLGYSPDRADSFMVALRVLRERLKIQAGSDQPQAASRGDWRALARKRDVVTKSDPNRHQDQLRKMFSSRRF